MFKKGTVSPAERCGFSQQEKVRERGEIIWLNMAYFIIKGGVIDTESSI